MVCRVTLCSDDATTCPSFHDRGSISQILWDSCGFHMVYVYKTFDGKSLMDFEVCHCLCTATKADLCRKKVTLGRNQPQEAITAVRSEFYGISNKYIENNLVWNKDGECYAYYELVPYNYSFLSPEQKIQVHDSFRQLIAQNRDGKIHALQISTESSIRSAQERSKNEVTGKLKAVAYDKIDQQTDALISMIGENQVNYRFFIGFKLLLNDQEFSMKSLTVEAKMLCLILSMM